MTKHLTTLILGLSFVLAVSAQTDTKKLFTEDLMTDSCTFTTTGSNDYFILEPGFQLTLQEIGGKDTIRLIITVLDDTKKVGDILTRVVEENESVNNKPVEISRNFFAFCKETSTIYYFGEEVDIYKDGKIVSNDGAWTAVGNNKAGVAMPGLILLGARYYQEIAPNIAMDRAEIITASDSLVTPAGSFKNVLKTEETNALKPKEKEYKYYAPGIGLIRDEGLLLTKFGFIKNK